VNFRKINFNNLSFESIKYEWDFGGGNTSTDKDPSYTFADGEGTYAVTLTALDANNASNTVTLDVEVVDRFVPLPVTILNGDFNGGSSDWKFETFTGGTTNPFNSSSDGSFTNYDGTDNGAKTKGAKWTKSTSAGAYLSSNTRYAYQPIIVSETLPDRTVKYILEYEYAIKTPAEQPGVAPGGNRIISEVLNAHYSDGADAVASDHVSQFIATEVKGKTSHTTVKQEFTTNSTGRMAIMFYAVTDVDLYIDNVKVYAAD
jgi:PKD repeat protein